jgi:hypothetical protein
MKNDKVTGSTLALRKQGSIIIMLDEKMDIYKCPKVDDALSKKPQKTKLQHNAVKNKNQFKNMTACFCKEKNRRVFRIILASFSHHYGMTVTRRYNCVTVNGNMNTSGSYKRAHFSALSGIRRY